MVKTKRKGAFVKYIGKNAELVETWGDTFEVYHKEGDFLRVSSVSKPLFGIVATIPEKDCIVL
jgi:hypothetical protein